MEIAVNSLFSALNPKMITVSHKHKHKQAVLNGFTPGSLRFSPHFRYDAPHQMKRRIHKYHPAVCAVISGVKDVGVSSSQFDDFSVAATSTSKGRELKLSVEIFGAKTQAIFDNVFDKMVAAAQPIPGFRRVKGGKTPNIPKDILLEVLGPSKVYEQVIKEVINSTIAEYVEKEGLKVSKDLRVEQSFEDLEATFEGMDIIGVISALAGAEQANKFAGVYPFRFAKIGLWCHCQDMYFYSLPYLLWRTPFPTLLRIFLFIGVEICWNIYPSNAYSSALLLCLHLVILWGLWSAPSEYPYVDHKAHK